MLGIAQVILPRARQILAERAAGQNPLARSLGASPFDRNLDQTLSRLGAMDNDGNKTWWNGLLTCFGQKIVQPDLFKIVAIKEWLSCEEVRTDLKGLARSYIHGVEAPAEINGRLAQAYMVATGEADHFAEGVIQITVAVLVAGALAPLDHGNRLLLDSQQGIRQDTQAIRQALDKLNGGFKSNPTLDAAAKEELERIKMRRFCPGTDSRAEVRGLVERIEHRDLAQTSAPVRAEVLRWAARLHALHKDSWQAAMSYLEQAEALHQGPPEDLAIIKAWIQFEQGAENEAIQSLRYYDSPQARSNKLSMLVVSKGNSTALEWAASLNKCGPELFSPVGWWKYAITLHSEGRWDEAIAALEPLSTEDWKECPDIPFVLGLFHAGQLLPEPMRHHVLDGNGSLIGLRLNEGQEADEHRNRAIAAFQKARELLHDLNTEDRIKGCDYWLMWLALSSPPTRDKSARQLQKGIVAGDDDLQFIDLAITYGVSFDWQQVSQQFQRRELEGGLTDREEAARFALLHHFASAELFLDYLDNRAAHLTKILDHVQLSLIRVETLIKAGCLDEAEHLLNTNPLLKDHSDIAGARLAIADARGQDVTGDALRIYQACDANPDKAGVLQALHNLVTALAQNNRWHDLVPHARRLYQFERTAENLNILAECLLRTEGHRNVLAELDNEADLLSLGTMHGCRLLERKAEALFHLGCFREARTVNDILLAQDAARANHIHRDIMIALRCGDWEHFPAIVDRLFSVRGGLSVPVLMQLAHAIGDYDRDADRVMVLLHEAASKAPDDANLQMGCYSLASKLGREDDAGPWLQRAIELSADGEGPLRGFSLDEVVEMARRNAETQDEKHSRFFSGQIALHLSAMDFGVPLSRLLVSIPRANERQPDGRSRLPIAIRSGNQPPMQPEAGASLSIDITTLLLLHEMDMLDVVWNAIGHVKVSPHIMDFLFREIRELPFHQPSRVERARTLIGHVEAGRIRVVEPAGADPRHEAEFGEEIAHLMDAARSQNGRVVAPAQIHKAGTLGKEIAEWGDAAPLALSTRQLVEGLRRLGYLERDACDAALAQLGREDSALPPGPELMDDAPLFIDDLALTYLTSAGMLGALVDSGLSLFIHPITIQMARQLVAADEEGRDVIPALKSLRQKLAGYYRQDRLSFLPEAPAKGEGDDSPERDDRCLMLYDLMYDLGSVDAVVIDDRWIGRNRNITDRQGKSVPVHGIIDLINSPAIDAQARRRALRQLWRRDFAFLPLDQEALREDLLGCHWEEGTRKFRESAELRAVRMTLCRIRSLKMLRIGDEIGWLNHLTMVAGLTIHQLWDDETISDARVGVLSDWLVDNLIPWPVDWQDSIAEGHWIDLELATVERLYPLIIIRPRHASNERKQAYGRWLEEKLIQPLLSTAPRVVDLVAESLAQQLAGMVGEISDELED